MKNRYSGRAVLDPGVVGGRRFAAFGAPRPISLLMKKRPPGGSCSLTARPRRAGTPSRSRPFPTRAGWSRTAGCIAWAKQGGGDIITDAEFNDFELQWEWKLAPAGNSGVKYFILETRKAALGHEYQMIDDERAPDAVKKGGKHLTASFYDVLAPIHARR